MDKLHSQNIIAIDFEYSAPDGERPLVVCMVAKELRTGETWRLFQNELAELKTAPFSVGEDTLFIAYYASAEINCFLSLDWQLPAHILDLFAEFRCLSNGLPPTTGGASLLGALHWHGLEGLDSLEKTEMRELAMRGGTYSHHEQAALLEYCESDVLALERLLPEMLPSLDVERALLRGRYMKAAARIEFNGIPIDTKSLTRLLTHWDQLQVELITELGREFGVYDGRSFKANRFAEYLIHRNIAWPLLPSGALDLSDDTFKDMARAHPELSRLRELRVLLSKLRLLMSHSPTSHCNPGDAHNSDKSPWGPWR